MPVKVSKAEAASRQLNEAIRLFFRGGDTIAIHTLAAAAGTVFADIAENQTSGSSWQQGIILQDSALHPKHYFKILRDTQDFLKHADHDPNGVHEFDDLKNDDLIAVAILDCPSTCPLSTEMQAFQIWYFAAHARRFGLDHSVVTQVLAVLPGIDVLPRADQIERGARFLDEVSSFTSATNRQEPS